MYPTHRIQKHPRRKTARSLKLIVTRLHVMGRISWEEFEALWDVVGASRV